MYESVGSVQAQCAEFDLQFHINQTWWCTGMIPAEGQSGVKATLGYIVSLRPTWDARDPVSKKNGRPGSGYL